MKGYFTFAKAPELEPRHQMQGIRLEGRSISFAEMQSAYSTASDDWAEIYLKTHFHIYFRANAMRKG